MLSQFVMVIAVAVAAAAVQQYSLVVARVPFNPDGYPRPIVGVFAEKAWAAKNYSRPSPGPHLVATVGDTLRVRFRNLLSEPVAIHFHGILHLNNPWVDGAMGITECGIPPGQSHSYEFLANQTGSYWYHAHSGVQYGDGLLGPLTVRYPPGADPVAKMYPYGGDYPVILQDWNHEYGADSLLRMQGPIGAFPGFTPQYPFPHTTLLINGVGTLNNRGAYNCAYIREEDCVAQRARGADCVPLRSSYFGVCDAGKVPPTPVFYCTERYVRLRLINGANNLPLRFWIEQHQMIVVARDGLEIEPVYRRYLTISAGQRYDLIIECNQSPVHCYRMFTSTSPPYMPGQTPELVSNAWLYYDLDRNKSTPLPYAPVNIYSNVYEDNVTIDFSWRPVSYPAMSPPASRRIILEYGFVAGAKRGDELELWVFNEGLYNYSFVAPREPPLLKWRRGGVPINMTEYTNPSKALQRVPYTLFLERGGAYEMVLVSRSGQQHPWHVHGYRVEFVQVGYLNKTDPGMPFDGEVDYDEIAAHNYTSPAPVLSVGDTWLVPPHGYVAFRIRAENVGPWLLHCHVEWHMTQGMAVLLSVQSGGGYAGVLDPGPDYATYCYPTGAAAPASQSPPEVFGSQTALIATLSLMTISIVFNIVFVVAWYYIFKRRPGGRAEAPAILLDPELVDLLQEQE